MRFRDVTERLERALKDPLPGPRAQDTLAPIPRRQWSSGFNPAKIRNAAGLLLVYPAGESRVAPEDTDAAHIVLTVRAHALRHGGQVSLPGGVVEPGETFEQAAVREAHEEIALEPGLVSVRGALTPIDIPVSGFRLHPVVGTADIRPALRPADGEVARILEIDLDELAGPDSVRLTERLRDGRAIRAPAFHAGDVEIWGATAMVLAEFLSLLGWNGGNL